MSVLNTVDWATIEGKEEGGGSSSIPGGYYKAKIKELIERSNKKHTGSGVIVVCEVSTGAHTGSEVGSWFNIVHETEKAATIGREALKDVANKAGLSNSQGPIEMIGREIIIKTGFNPPNEQGYSNSTIEKFISIDDANTITEDMRKDAHKEVPERIGQGDGGGGQQSSNGAMAWD